MIFISAGHHLKDSGAIGPTGRQENKEAIEFRDIVCNMLTKRAVKFIKDDDKETLPEYLKRIETGSGSVVIEFHFDSYNGKASGTTALVGNYADRLDKAFAKEIVDITATALSIPNRGVKTEAQSNRGRLGLMREQGVVCLLELAFIDNVNDMAAYDFSKEYLANKIADIIIRYESLL
jgi:N-acetylmuramoyl-L-alanine amidase